jgi:hypothetical protein
MWDSELRDQLLTACNAAHADRREVLEALVDVTAAVIVRTSTKPNEAAASVAECLRQTVSANRAHVN